MHSIFYFILFHFIKFYPGIVNSILFYFILLYFILFSSDFSVVKLNFWKKFTKFTKALIAAFKTKLQMFIALVKKVYFAKC